WYFSWEENAQNEVVPVSADAEVFDVSKHDWHESAVAMSENGLSGHVCWESPAGRKRFRSLVRSIATRNVSGLVLQNAEPHLCLSAAHLERSKKVTLLHWDINDFIELYSWGNRQLLRSGVSLRIVAPAGSVFSKLPSGRRLSMIPTQRISGA
ncbi:MAG: hypothetical protein WC071_11445, partial [Victivallaceae bacterium]